MKLIIIALALATASAAMLTLRDPSGDAVHIAWDGQTLNIPQHTQKLADVESKVDDLRTEFNTLVGTVGQLRTEFDAYTTAEASEARHDINIEALQQQVDELNMDVTKTPLNHHAFTCASGTVDQDARKCTCALNKYGGGTYVSGTAYPACHTCSNINCSTNYYQSGKCSTDDGNNFKCNACSNTSCGANKYQTGSCGGRTNGFQCADCENASCATGEYQSGACGGNGADKRNNNFVCNECSNKSCGNNQYQSGSCSGRNDGFMCNECSNSDCSEEFTFVNQRKTWDDAKAYCESMGETLAPIRTYAELVKVQSLYDGDLWVGINDKTTEGTWVNVDGTEAYLRWGSGEPNNSGGEDCVHLRGDHYYNDNKCSSGLYRFVCRTKKYRSGTCSGRINGYQCNVCDNQKCATNFYQAGSCSGTSNGLTCNACSNQSCGPDMYRTGSCSGRNNGYQCNECTNQSCGAGQYRTGTCSGTSNGYQCNECENMTCGAGQYRTGTCSGTSNGYQCKACENMTCGANQYRSGSCSGTSNGYTCNTCSNINCPTGYTRTGSCSGTSNGYTCVKVSNPLFVTTTMTWDNARDYCQNLGRDLVSIHSTAEAAAVASLIGNTHVWIGYNDKASEGTWKNPDGTSAFTDWNSGEPNNSGDEDCAMMYGDNPNKWNDAKCSNKYAFVCSEKTGANPCETIGEEGWHNIEVEQPDGVHTIYTYCFKFTGQDGNEHWADAKSVSGTRTYKHTDANSCPAGTNIWVPRSEDHMKKVAEKFTTEYTELVGVYGESNGCGCCTGHAMNSATCQDDHWNGVKETFTDGTTPSSPWYILPEKITEPNGDYHAGCWLHISSRHSDGRAKWLNDGNCNYSFTKYVCSTNRYT